MVVTRTSDGSSLLVRVPILVDFVLKTLVVVRFSCSVMLASVSRRASCSGRLAWQKPTSDGPWFLPRFLAPSRASGFSHPGAVLSGQPNVQGYACFQQCWRADGGGL